VPVERRGNCVDDAQIGAYHSARKRYGSTGRLSALGLNDVSMPGLIRLDAKMWGPRCISSRLRGRRSRFGRICYLGTISMHV
jgi:hypothetical protein